MCLNFHLLYYLKTTCKTCEHARYKLRTCRRRTLVAYRKLRYFLITPRLQKLFMSSKIIEHMTWNYSHDVVDRVMVTFLMVKPRNILIGCIINFNGTTEHTCWVMSNRFNLFGSFVASYLFWPVILTIYNLPPMICV
jgi:hypothetical protein